VFSERDVYRFHTGSPTAMAVKPAGGIRAQTKGLAAPRPMTAQIARKMRSDSAKGSRPMSASPSSATSILALKKSRDYGKILTESLSLTTMDSAHSTEFILDHQSHNKQDSYGRRKDSKMFSGTLIDEFTRTAEERHREPDKLDLNGKCLIRCINLHGEEKLRFLNYQCNMIKKIENMSNLTNLVLLDLYNNQIEEMTGIESLVTLEVLMLGKNRIKKIEGIGSCKLLDVLDLHCNEITEIQNIEHLTKLRVLNLEDNKYIYNF
jgi:Leucine-rich repeat (LRR) protein